LKVVESGEKVPIGNRTDRSSSKARKNRESGSNPLICFISFAMCLKLRGVTHQVVRNPTLSGRLNASGDDEGHDRIADSVEASGKEAVRVSLLKTDRLAPQSMENTPESREHMLQKALERLADIQPSHIPELTHGWLEVLSDGVPHGTKLAPRTAGGVG
jgi:hypothetical protein